MGKPAASSSLTFHISSCESPFALIIIAPAKPKFMARTTAASARATMPFECRGRAAGCATRLCRTEDSPDLVEQDGFGTGKVMQNIADAPSAWPAGLLEVFISQIEVLQRLCPGALELFD